MAASSLPSSGLPSSGLPSSGLPSSGLPRSGLSRFGHRSPRRRAASIALTVAAHLLIAWLLLHLGPSWVSRSDEPSLSTFDVAASPGRIESPTPRAAQKPRAAAGGAPAAVRAVRTPLPQPTPVPQTDTAGPAMLALDYDLGKAPRRGSGEGDTDGDAKGDSVAAYGPGAGPGGERLYNVEWQRRPRPAEIAGYLRTAPEPGSWAIVACRTIPDNQVENCRTVSEAPAGSGLARTLREAAWQFRIYPPRIGGRALIGTWIGVCYDFAWDDQHPRHCRSRDD